jgi:hypothetical protein
MIAGAAVIGLLLVRSAGADEPSSDSASASPRVVVEKNGLSTRVETESEYEIRVELAPKAAKGCRATMTTSADQRNTIARVEGTIENPDCAACGGEYTMVVRIREESGEIRSLEFASSWQRADDKPVKFTTDYPIGENVDLLGVVSKGLRCVCTDAPVASAAE